MRVDQGSVEHPIRTLFVSDLHLGSRHSRADAFLAFLDAHEPEAIYLVGDIIDGWKLRRTWHWPATYNRIARRLLELARRGTQLYYAPGNHDEFLRDVGCPLDFVNIDFADEFVHVTADHRRFLVLHGDRFDDFERRAPYLSIVSSVAYELLLTADRLVHVLLRSPRRLGFSAALKRSVKKLVRFISDFERRLAEHAREQNCAGVICGHIHAPNIVELGDVTYCNTGDWVEHCTALVEFDDGELQLVSFEAGSIRKLSSRPPLAEWRQPVASWAPRSPREPEPALACQSSQVELASPSILGRLSCWCAATARSALQRMKSIPGASLVRTAAS